MSVYYKIVEWKNDAPHTLFHGLNRSRKLPVDKWITAEQKIVDDGGRPYVSGFHVFMFRENAEDYLKRFRAPKDRRIVACLAKTIWQKPTNELVWLAERIKILYDKSDS